MENYFTSFYNELITEALRLNHIAPTFEEGMDMLADEVERFPHVSRGGWILDELYLGATVFQNTMAIPRDSSCLNHINAAFAIGEAAKIVAKRIPITSPANPKFESTLTSPTVTQLRSARIKDISDATFGEFAGSLNFFHLPFTPKRLTDRETEYIVDLKTGALAQKVNSSFLRIRSAIHHLMQYTELPEVVVIRYGYLLGLLDSVSSLIDGYFADFPRYIRKEGKDEVAFIRSLSRNIRRIIIPMKRELSRLPLDYIMFLGNKGPETRAIERIALRTAKSHELIVTALKTKQATTVY